MKMTEDRARDIIHDAQAFVPAHYARVHGRRFNLCTPYDSEAYRHIEALLAVIAAACPSLYSKPQLPTDGVK
jgi:hypothetical protein